MPLPQKKERFTYADYAAWDDGERWELIDGAAYAMSPAPTPKHQDIVGYIYRKIADYLEGKSCKVYLSPIDVRLNADTYDDTVVQPDIIIVCDKTKIDAKGCVGVPDMIAEVLSPSTSRHDRFVKFRLYQKYGVREYWIVDPDNKTVEIHILMDGNYVKTAYGDTDFAPVYVLGDCEINLTEVFAE